jgi:predicted Rossmann fold nucleotide-binding protein DprA/Smf involved in DNA uptake
MAIDSSDHKRKALAFAEGLAKLARDAPDEETKGDVYRAVASIRSRCGFSKVDKADEVLYFIRLGASTIADLAEETGFRYRDIQEITKELELAGKIRQRNIKAGEAGRPQVCYFANDADSIGFSPSKI